MFLGKPHSFRNTKNLEKNITALICLEAFGFAELDYERSVGQEEPWHQPKFPTKRKGAAHLPDSSEDGITKQKDPAEVKTVPRDSLPLEDSAKASADTRWKSGTFSASQSAPEKYASFIDFYKYFLCE